MISASGLAPQGVCCSMPKSVTVGSCSHEVQWTGVAALKGGHSLWAIEGAAVIEPSLLC